MGNVVGVTINISLDHIGSCSCCWRRKCSTRQNFQSLQNDWDRLQAARNDVITKIELEERQHHRRLETVDEWLQKVAKVEIKIDKLRTDYEQQSANKCFCGYCPKNFKTSSVFWKKVVSVRKDLITLFKRKPDKVAQKLLIRPPAERPVEQTIGMHCILNEVWSYMEDGQVGIIALHGMGGVGKTTLLTELNNKLCNSTQSFDVVLWIVISSTPSLSKIQNDIGCVLGFQSDEWQNKSQEDKALDIFSILKGKKYVLFLDDVWQRLDLLILGVPRPDLTNKSKIVLTTRSKEVCGNMEAHKKIEVPCLKEEEGWNLFREKVGENTINSHPEIQELAKFVAKECHGLPLALIVIGRVMACKTTPRAWNSAKDRLKKYSPDFAGMGEHILPLLKFSYDNIPNSAMQCCFLYCSLYPEDHLIYKEDIIDKWICEGFLDKFVDLHEARNEGYDYIDSLINASLLEESSIPELIKMHDIIREMATWIACECGIRKNKFFVCAGVGLTEAPNAVEFEGSERMSLMVNRIDKINGKPNCPNLLTLFLNEAKLNDIDNEFFQSMSNLRVLDLSGNENLMEIPDEVCNLVTLEYLNLSCTGLSKFPANLHKLINLKWLSFLYTFEGTQFPEGLLSSLKKLQVLDILHTVVVFPQTFVVEIESLKHLKDLRIQIFGDDELSRFSSSHKVGSIITTLHVSRTSSRTLNFLSSQKMVNLKLLYIYDCVELEYVISKEMKGTSEMIDNNYMQRLKSLTINWCPKLKNITQLAFCSNIESIYIDKCEGMKELCGEWKWRTTPFPKLNYLGLFYLSELERIHPNATLFPCLETMHINECPKLKKLPFNSNSCNSGTGFTIKGKEEWWKELEWEDEATRTTFRRSFKPLA